MQFQWANELSRSDTNPHVHIGLTGTEISRHPYSLGQAGSLHRPPQVSVHVFLSQDRLGVHDG